MKINSEQWLQLEETPQINQDSLFSQQSLFKGLIDAA